MRPVLRPFLQRAAPWLMVSLLGFAWHAFGPGVRPPARVLLEGVLLSLLLSRVLAHRQVRALIPTRAWRRRALGLLIAALMGTQLLSEPRLLFPLTTWDMYSGPLSNPQAYVFYREDSTHRERLDPRFAFPSLHAFRLAETLQDLAFIAAGDGERDVPPQVAIAALTETLQAMDRQLPRDAPAQRFVVERCRPSRAEPSALAPVCEEVLEIVAETAAEEGGER